ncbi:DNA-binding transcriptional LysR family regulator [Spinactinospora alkalitolerans]|uniref:DNA-binding transcriptional LysR family regulator n=1 Tax=Spinactinospora alkalitolerans TaxID=687207 RepID=A0A852TXF3_9ACTN|nr:LysR substrate-binding domain-containing protein [Spinactinospora alkalitolerans]NYE48045.1 DNA-binding transcriptional LysR family regulator [Spinactinospora alkalitolerans]
MEVRQLRYVVRLAETLHFGRAAQLEHIAQSAFSGHVARLERELGVRLFDRSHHRVALTPAGAAFVERAEQMLTQLADAAAEARAQAMPEQEVLRVGTFAEAAGELMPIILSLYRELRPDVRLEFTELSMVDQLEKLVSEEVDVAVVRAPFEDDRIALRPIFSEPRVAVLPRQHPLADAESMSVDDLLDEPFAAADTGAPAGWASYWTCDDRRGEPGRVATHVRSVGEGLMAISCLGAVDTFPQTAARLFRHSGVAYVPLPDATPSTINAATRQKDTRPHVQAFHLAVKHAIDGHLDVVPEAVRSATA